MHNLHCLNVNYGMLFKYIKNRNIKAIWTLHDCWAFTGQCPYFTMVKCEKWKSGCHDCVQFRQYPAAYVDRTKRMYKLKRKWFTGIEKMTVVTPSKWLAELAKESYLNCYPIKVINNGIDLNIFKPTESGFREKYKCVEKFILLGVAFGWSRRKGLDVFIELAKQLKDNYQIVLIGTDDNVDKQLPRNIISIHKTNNQKELAEIYTSADLFVNPTREENFPTVNIEALACGTPVVTFNTGGSAEIIDDTCGRTVECDDIKSLILTIEDIYISRPYTQEQCVKRASNYDMNKKFMEYIELYTNEK